MHAVRHGSHAHEHAAAAAATAGPAYAAVPGSVAGMLGNPVRCLVQEE